MKVLIDTNVLIDYMTEREPFYAEAKRIINLCVESLIDGCIAANSLVDSIYIMRKYPKTDVRELLLEMCEVMTVVGIDGAKVKAVLENLDFDDLEDCLQSLCAEECGAKYIITRNVKDFSGSKVPPVTPTDFLANL